MAPLVLSILTLTGINSPVVAHASSNVTTYKLLWADNFTGKKGTFPNSHVWVPELGGLNANGELEFYTKSPTNIALDGKGHLVITADRIADSSMLAIKKDPNIEKMLNSCNSCQFTSAKIKTAGKLSFEYGRMDIRMKSASGLGTWPAFWMLGTDLLKGVPWPDAGEIDIMEGRGSSPTLVYGTLHGPGMQDSGAGYGSAYDAQSAISSGFHTYSIEWKKNRIDFFVDDNLYFTAKSSDSSAGSWVYNQPFYLILNLAIGGGFAGDLDPTLNQAQISVDYIRFYSINGVGAVFKK